MNMSSTVLEILAGHKRKSTYNKLPRRYRLDEEECCLLVDGGRRVISFNDRRAGGDKETKLFKILKLLWDHRHVGRYSPRTGKTTDMNAGRLAGPVSLNNLMRNSGSRSEEAVRQQVKRLAARLDNEKHLPIKLIWVGSKLCQLVVVEKTVKM